MSSSHLAETSSDPTSVARPASEVPAVPLDPLQTNPEQRTNRVRLWNFIRLLLLSQIVLVVVNYDVASNELVEWVLIGLLLGTIMGSAFTAGLWTVFGPMAGWPRLGLSLGWIMLSLGSLALNSRFRQDADIEVMGACMLTIWIFCQLLWLVRLPLQIRVGVPSDNENENAAPQFSIRSLLGLMLATACLLSAAKYGLSRINLEEIYQEFAVIVFLGVATLLLNIPVYLSCLWPSSHYKVALAAALLLIGLISVIESSLFDLLNSGPAPIGVLLPINLVQAAWVIAFSLLLRSYGYRLRIGGKAMVGTKS